MSFAAVPPAAMVLWGLKDVVDLIRDSTSHNLLPFEFVIGAEIESEEHLAPRVLAARDGRLKVQHVRALVGDLDAAGLVVSGLHFD